MVILESFLVLAQIDPGATALVPDFWMRFEWGVQAQPAGLQHSVFFVWFGYAVWPADH